MKERDMDSILDTVKVVATNLDDVWFQCLEAVVEHGYVYYIDRGSYIGQHRLQIGKLNLRIRNPGIRPLIPQMPPRSIIPPPIDEDFLDEYLPYLMTGEKKPTEQYTYGSLMNAHEFYEEDKNGNVVLRVVDQYSTVVKMVAEDPGTNQAAIAVCEPQSMFLPDPPCLRQIIVQVVKGYLCFHVTFRSWDLWGGLPGNLAAIQLMKELMLDDINALRKKWGEKEFLDGQLMAECPGAHLYDHDWNVAEMRLVEPKGSIKEKHKHEMKPEPEPTELLEILKTKKRTKLMVSVPGHMDTPIWAEQ